MASAFHMTFHVALLSWLGWLVQASCACLCCSVALGQPQRLLPAWQTTVCSLPLAVGHWHRTGIRPWDAGTWSVTEALALALALEGSDHLPPFYRCSKQFSSAHSVTACTSQACTAKPITRGSREQKEGAEQARLITPAQMGHLVMNLCAMLLSCITAGTMAAGEPAQLPLGHMMP